MDYEIEVKKSIYEVNSVKLYYPEIFPNKAVEGTFTDKIVASTNAREGSYPRFESKENVLEIAWRFYWKCSLKNKIILVDFTLDVNSKEKQVMIDLFSFF